MTSNTKDTLIGVSVGLGLLAAVLFGAVLIVIGDTAVPALSTLFRMVG